jgi:predicted DNA-binding transcriptional regulator AlpA
MEIAVSEADQLIERLAEAVAAKANPAVPYSVKLWSIETIAEYMDKSVTHVRQRVVCLPDFPKAYRLGQPRYKATEVVAWMERHKEK